MPLREYFRAALVTRPLQLPFVLRAIKSVPLDDPEVCRNWHTHIIIRRKIMFSLLHDIVVWSHLRSGCITRQ